MVRARMKALERRIVGPAAPDHKATALCDSAWRVT
jgi:hypothetical protein